MTSISSNYKKEPAPIPDTACLSERNTITHNQIAIGRDFFAVVDCYGKVHAFGDEVICNDVKEWNSIIAIAAGFDHLVGLRRDGRIVTTGNRGEFTQDSIVRTWADVVAVDACEGHTAAVFRNGLLRTADEDHYEVSKFNDYIKNWSNISQIAVGINHIVGLRKDGTVVAYGSDWEGTCSVSHWSGIKEIDVFGCYYSESQTIGLTVDGRVLHTGCKFKGVEELSKWSSIVSISSGNGFVAALKDDGSVFAVGRNYEGQCNVTDWEHIIALKADFFNTVAVKENGMVLSTQFPDLDMNILI